MAACGLGDAIVNAETCKLDMITPLRRVVGLPSRVRTSTVLECDMVRHFSAPVKAKTAEQKEEQHKQFKVHHVWAKRSLMSACRGLVAAFLVGAALSHLCCCMCTGNAVARPEPEAKSCRRAL